MCFDKNYTFQCFFSFSRCSIFNDQVLTVASLLIILQRNRKVKRFFDIFLNFFRFLNFVNIQQKHCVVFVHIYQHINLFLAVWRRVLIRIFLLASSFLAVLIYYLAIHNEKVHIFIYIFLVNIFKNILQKVLKKEYIYVIMSMSKNAHQFM